MYIQAFSKKIERLKNYDNLTDTVLDLDKIEQSLVDFGFHGITLKKVMKGLTLDSDEFMQEMLLKLDTLTDTHKNVIVEKTDFEAILPVHIKLAMRNFQHGHINNTVEKSNEEDDEYEKIKTQLPHLHDIIERQKKFRTDLSNSLLAIDVPLPAKINENQFQRISDLQNKIFS